MRWLQAVMLCIALAQPGIAPSQSLDNPILGQAEALLKDGQAEEAWKLLAPLEARHAGEADFDYLLAVAALESGRPDRATFILERVIALNPGHMAARLEMARAYFALRDFERAEREFNIVLRSGPAAETRALIGSYLARMKRPAAAGDPGFSGYAEAVYGRDTNVPAAAARGSVFIPSLAAEFTPDPLSTRRPDDFTRLGAGVEYGHPVGRNLDIVAGAELQQRMHSELDVFDSRSVDLHGALVHRLNERDNLQYTLRHSSYDLDYAAYRRMQSAGVQWARSFGERARLAVSGQGYRIRYMPELLESSSSDLVAGGLNLAYVLDAATRTVAQAGFYGGWDNAVADRADGDRRLYGLSVGLQRVLKARLEAFAAFSLLYSDYERPNADFGITRRDRQRDLAVGLAWNFADGWSLRPQVAGTRNRSNLPLNDYRRTETSLTLRRTWD
jgi:tetratricopeptide (TPR) repeat protein